MTGGGARPQRSGPIDGASWTLYDAARAPSGLGLGYFVCDDPGMADRRTALPAGLALSDLDDEAFRALWEAGRQLTRTERRVVGGDGAIWLAQSMGPVWAEGGSARRPVVELNGATLSDMSDAELIARVGAPEGVAPSSD